MIEIEGGTSSLAKLNSGVIAKPETPLSVGQLERALLERFPAEDAESWDRTGLLVGDPTALVTGVAVALDVTAEALDAASQAQANVLLTHHPAYLDAPGVLSPSRAIADAAGANAYEAIARGIALVNFHTALDVSEEGCRMLPGMLGLIAKRALVPLAGDPSRGYGIACELRPDEHPFKLAHLAARCTSVFGRPARVWGDFSHTVRSVVCANGSAGNVVEEAVRAHADCLVCGEIRYHAALDASQAGLAIVELGHDVSELPLTAILAQAAIDAGMPSAKVKVVDQSANWATPESTRI